jgi:hypothetical protein
VDPEWVFQDSDPTFGFALIKNPDPTSNKVMLKQTIFLRITGLYRFIINSKASILLHKYTKLCQKSRIWALKGLNIILSCPIQRVPDSAVSDHDPRPKHRGSGRNTKRILRYDKCLGNCQPKPNKKMLITKEPNSAQSCHNKWLQMFLKQEVQMEFFHFKHAFEFW